MTDNNEARPEAQAAPEELPMLPGERTLTVSITTYNPDIVDRLKRAFDQGLDRDNAGGVHDLYAEVTDEQGQVLWGTAFEPEEDEGPGHDKTLNDLRDAAIAALPEKTDLIYVDQGDKLMDNQIAFVAAGDRESLFESIADWEMEARDIGVKYAREAALDEVRRDWEREYPEADFQDLFDEFEHTEQDDELREAIVSRDESDPIKDLANASGSVLMRVRVWSEDDCFSHEEVAPEQVLAKLPLIEDTPANRKVIADTLLECSPEYSTLLGYWVFGINVGDLYALPEDGEVEVTNPYLYMGNPFAGSGWVSEEPLQGKARIPRAELTTDKAAFGYSLNEVYGGLSASSFDADVRHIPTKTDDNADTEAGAPTD